MFPLVLWLASCPPQGAASAVQTQTPARLIRVGERALGVLPLSPKDGRNVARVDFELEIVEKGAFTATLESLDFNAWLSISDPAGGASSEDGSSGVLTNAWLVHEAAGPAKLRVQVGSEDERGGEFKLSILAGRVNPPQEPVERARATIRYCEAAAERALAGDDPDRALRFLSIACQYSFSLKDLAGAKRLADRHLEIAQEKDRPFEAARARAHLGLVERMSGNLDAAEKLLLEALPPAEQRLEQAKTPAEEQGPARLLVLIYGNLGDLVAAGSPGALSYVEKEVKVAARARNPAGESLAWRRLGIMLARLGNFEKARGAMESGQTIAEGLDDPQALASALLDHGRLLIQNGKPADGRLLCERALGLSPASRIRIEILGTVAGAYINLGLYEQASASLDDLEKLCAEHRITDFEIPTRIDRAVIAYHLGDFPGARKLLEEALGLQATSGPPEQRVDILVDLGLVLKESGNDEEARLRYEEALEACELAGDRSREARVRVDIADLDVRQPDYPAALAEFDRAQDVAEEIGDSTMTAVARGGRGYVLCLMGDLSPAREIARSAAKELESLGEWEKAIDAHDTLARIGLKQNDLGAVEDALCAAEQLFDRQDQQKLDLFSSAGLRSRFADWGGIAQDVVARRLESAPSESMARAPLIDEGWTQAGRWKGRALLDRMRQGSAAVGSARPRLGPRTAIVDYADGLGKLYAYVALDESVQFVDLGERAPIEERARRFSEVLSGVDTPPARVAEDGAWLYSRLLSPLLRLLPAQVETLVIVPTPALAVLPFEALVQPATGANQGEQGFDQMRYLIDDFCVVYAPSSPVLAELQRRGPVERAPRYLVLGDPVYEQETSGTKAEEKLVLARPGSTLVDYRRLKFTREEALAIAKLLLVKDAAATDEQRAKLLELELPSRRDGRLATATFDLYLGKDAQRDILSGDLSRYSGLHVATHGLVDTDDPRRSGLRLSYDPATEGRFPLEDVLALRLDAGLVVLSACDTARGAVVRGEGVQSLAWAFLHAGSRSVIASLWRLEDDSAKDVMKEFYGLHLDGRLHPAKALREAKLQLRRSSEPRGPGLPVVGSTTQKRARTAVAANPYYWSPFIFIGAPPE